MRSVSIRLSDLDGGNKLIPIGFVGENEYTTINIDCKKVFDQHPNAVPALAVTPPQGDSYPAIVVRDGDIISWTVCDSDLIYEGSGALQLTFVIDGTVIGKTYKARTKILGSIEPSGEVPTPIANWLTQAAAALQGLPQEVSDAVVALMGAMVGIGETLDPDESVTVNYDTATNTLTIGVPKGKDGHDGQDGHTPVISAQKVGKVTTFYVDGVAIATVNDGQDGAGIDDTTKSTTSTWSSKKIDDENSALKTEINSKADEPTGTKSAGKVYGLDSNLDPAWVDGGGGSVDPQDIAQAVADWCDENITEDPTVVIDKSLQTSGAAADSFMAGSAVKQVKGDLAIISEDMNLFDIMTAQKSGRIDPSGAYAISSGYFTSDFIAVENGKTYYKNSPTEDAYHRYALYSSASESGYITDSASNSNIITINNANAKYLRFCGAISEIGTARLYTGTPSAVDVKARFAKDRIDYYAPMIEGNYDASHWFKESSVSITANEKGYIDSNGTVQSINASYYYSDMISVSPGERYHIKGTGVGSSARYWCMYKDGVKVEISDAGTSSSSVIDHEFYLTIPYGVNQLRTCWCGASTNCEVYKRNPLPLSENTKSISILFVGNSLTQDGIAYLPYMLKHYYPEVNFKFYMWYMGGQDLSQQYTAFSNNSYAEIFSVAENTEAWTNYNYTRTMATILSTYKFDVVCLQEYFNSKSSYTDSDLDDFNNCRDYIVEHYTGGNPLEFITLLHAPKRDNAAGIFGVTETGNGLMLQKTVAQDMIANGISVYRALSTDLDDLGDQGHLSPDGVHTQEGLPCLLQTYVTLCWLIEKLAINKSVYGCPFRMTTAIYNTLNVPGPNLGTGVITGTDAQNLLAQEVAIKAYKEGKKFVIDNLMPE